ncbi:MAG UNVERIFIED_CONTAM: hypothetical protein LVR18_36390 [Planctomycetaceae bacterium]
MTQAGTPNSLSSKRQLRRYPPELLGRSCSVALPLETTLGTTTRHRRFRRRHPPRKCRAIDCSPSTSHASANCHCSTASPGPGHNAENLPSTPHVCLLEQAIRINPGVRLPPGPALLCSTTARSCWTITVAATLLAEAGSPDTLALILHRKP